MQIDISGHHLEVTDGIRQAIQQKFEKISTHYPQIDHCQVTLTVERNEQIAEVTTLYLGTSIAVTARNQDLYAAIAELVKKLDAKLSHKKGSSNAGRHKKPLIEEASI